MDRTQFNLKWNNHSYNIVQVFLEQLSSESLVDVTLSCQGQFLKAHKMVLSACSSYFQDLFNVHEAQHPVIILNGINFQDLKMVIEFMYKGEARVLESELSGILSVAEALQVKGLSNVRNVDEYGNNPSNIAPDTCFPTVDMNEDFSSDFQFSSPATDPLDVSFPLSESNKVGKKRKRMPEVNKDVLLQDGSAKHQRSEAGFSPMEVPRLRAIAPKPSATRSCHTKVSSQKTTSPKASPPKASPSKGFLSKSVSHQAALYETTPLIDPSHASPTRSTSPETCAASSLQGLPEVHTLAGDSHMQSEFQSPTSSSKESSQISADKASFKPPAKTYPAKTPSLKGNSKPSKSSKVSSTSPHPSDQGNDAQAVHNKEPDDDNDLATTIKVEPLFIRDIDDNDTSWDDPSRLVIDLPLEDSDGKRDESNSPHCENSESPLSKNEVQSLPKPKPKPKLKVRPTSELVALSGASNLADPLSLEDKVGKDVELPKERLKGDRIPRPPNAFMIFANEWRKKLAIDNPCESNKQISVRLGLKWKGLNPEKKETYFCAARRADEEHKRKYPGYFYSPKEARLRKAMRHQRQQRNPSISTAEVPLQPSKNSKEPNRSTELFDVASLADASLVVKEELLEEDHQPQNLEEEFLKMVEDGQVEAETEVKNDGSHPNCDQASSVDRKT